MDPDLADLQHHWGSAYMISHPAPDAWLAQRRDDYQSLTAATPRGLLELIRADYLARPVPRMRPRRTWRRRETEPSA